MTDEQMRIKIAEACGFANISFMCWRGHLDGYERCIPDYPADLNACAEFEAMLTSAERFTYLVELNKLCGDEPSSVWATARQRAEAFLKTKGILP